MRRFHMRAAAAVVVLVTLVSGCAGRRAKGDEKRTAEFVAAQDVYNRAQDELARRNLRKARQMFEKVVYTAQDRTRLEPLVRVGLADSMFYLGDDLSLIEARAKYQDFVTLYGNHTLAPYAGFQAGVCSLKQVRAPARDQSDTHLAIGDLRDVVRRWPEARFSVAANDAIADAESNLAEHEFLIGRFYLQRKKYGAAAARFRYLNETYPRYAAKDKLYLNLGKAVYLAEGPSAGQAWFDRLLADYPDSKPAGEAKIFLAKTSAKPKERADRAKPKPPASPPADPKATDPQAADPKGEDPAAADPKAAEAGS